MKQISFFIYSDRLILLFRSQSALSTRDPGVSSLKNCWEILKCEEKSFSTLVTGAFPPARDQDSVIHELRAERWEQKTTKLVSD